MSFPRFSSSHNIQFYGDHIFTTVTPSAAIVDEWIANTRRIYRRKLSKLLVGLDTEWCLPAQPGGYQKVAIIQLCVGKRCLIFQLYHADYIPQSLIRFLGNKKFTFVGKEVQNDADKLFQDYKLHVAHTKDVGYWAAKKYDDSEYRRMGLKALVSDLLQKVIPKPRQITLSRWNAKNLRVEQIEYACLDAFVSFELGLLLSKPIQEITHSPEVVHLTPETVAQLDELFGRVGRRCEEIEPVRQLVSERSREKSPRKKRQNPCRAGHRECIYIYIFNKLLVLFLLFSFSHWNQERMSRKAKSMQSWSS
ncbi:hypothetical protein P3X46_000250 [Hevea brasiliensis]|uniref:3'-5' exonuclease domain-containing protein n=1 Tax=Hevea brasiliensis TaxID=3981 RepID=A0ABQ9NAC7_HEVBR|nr:hypothetical protein P3X46_000250 [Hevea brasiliensis]